jgi:histidinol-phosphate aminotransferase
MNILDLARPHLRAIEPYRSARSLVSGGETLLDANESPRVLSDAPTISGLNRYPAPQPPALVREASRYYQMPPSQILVTRGADEGIDLLVRAFVEPGKQSILITPPTYGVYAIAARLHGAGVVDVPLSAQNNFAVDQNAIVAALGPTVKLVFICRPNNPTGTDVPLAIIESLAARLAGQALLVVDEAYLEFSTEPSASSLIARFNNIVVLKTLSKVWGLAGARVGFMIADPAIITLMQTVRAPYPISATTARATEIVFNATGEATMRQSVADIIRERERLAVSLKKLSCVSEVVPSQANFLVARFKNKDAALGALRAEGIITRDRSSELGLSDGVRITVGLPEENTRLLKVLETING